MLTAKSMMLQWMIVLIISMVLFVSASCTNIDSICGSLHIVDPMFKAFYGGGETASSLPPPLRAPAVAVRGQMLHVQAVLELKEPTLPSNVNISIATSFSTVESFVIRYLHYADYNLTFDPSNPPGRYPDALVPLGALSDPIFSSPQSGMVFWVRVAIDRDAVPGDYVEEVRVRIGSECALSATFSARVSTWTAPIRPTQLTGAQFIPRIVASFGNTTNVSPCAVLEWFRTMRDTGYVNSLVWFELDALPFAPKYTFNEDKTKVSLNTTEHEKWFPQVLNITGATHWRMPFSSRIHSLPHLVDNNSTWTFFDHDAKPFVVKIFDGESGALDTEFERLFLVLFRATATYLERMGWTETGSWVQISDEPTWTDNATLRNSLAIMDLYRNASESVKIFQTRYPIDTPGAPSYEALIDHVDWWCAHVCQWVTPSVPEALAALRKRRVSEHREFHVTVYDNGVPIIESPWERVRSQGLDVWRSNGTVEGTLSWYSVNSYGAHEDPVSGKSVADPWLNPYPTPKAGTVVDPAGWGYLFWPQVPSLRQDTDSAERPIESVRWLMLGMGIEDAEALYALENSVGASSSIARALIEQARGELATAFAHNWNAGCTDNNTRRANWEDDGYNTDQKRKYDGVVNGSSTYNTWKLAVIEALDAFAKTQGRWMG